MDLLQYGMVFFVNVEKALQCCIVLVRIAIAVFIALQCCIVLVRIAIAVFIAAFPPEGNGSTSLPLANKDFS